MRETDANVKSILIVEDEPGIAEVCTRVLSAEGFRDVLSAEIKRFLDEAEFGR